MDKSARLFKNPIFWAFLLCFSYWTFLFATARMIIDCDAVGYEALGRMLLDKGWMEFFRTGPNREPGYPLLVAFNMGLGKISPMSFEAAQVLSQLLFLLITQLLTLRILKILKINSWISAAAILYLGISPALLNSALSLYSEIATYPLILAIILVLNQSWRSFAGNGHNVLLWGKLTGLLFVLMTLSKGIFELVTPVFFTLFFILTLSTRDKKVIRNACKYLAVVLVLFYSLVGGYKWLNKSFNGRFAVTDRGAWALYGNISRRMEPLTTERFLSALAYVPGEGVCQSIFGPEKCFFWSFTQSDAFGHDKLGELSHKKLGPEGTNNELVKLALGLIRRNPGQFILLTAVEAGKMFFWESTQIGFVAYPPGLTRIFNWVLFKNGLRLGIALLTLAALFYLKIKLWRQRKEIFSKEKPFLLLLLILLFIGVYICSYAVFYIITRYALPIASLYVVIIAYAANDLLSARSQAATRIPAPKS